ncbi:hypothetical protein Tco_0661511 [Tanacetum coccineum]
MHNNIMAAGSKVVHQCLQQDDMHNGAVPATEDSTTVPKQTTVETVMNMSPKNKAHFESEKEAIHLILTGIGDEIYSTVDACQTSFKKCRKHRKAKQDMQENLALIAKYFKKIYKPNNNNLRTSLNTRNKNVDTTTRYKNDNQTGQFGNQRAVNVAGARETECRKPKWVKDSAYHKEKMLLCKQAEKGLHGKIPGVPNADSGTDVKPLEQVHMILMKDMFASIEYKLCEQSESICNTCAVETGDNNVLHDSLDMCDNDIQDDQNDVECDDERVALANLIANLKLDVVKIKDQKQLKTKQMQH